MRNPSTLFFPVALAGAQHKGHDTNKSQFNFKGLDVRSHPPPLFFSSLSSVTINIWRFRTSCSSQWCTVPEEVHAHSYTTGLSLWRYINLSPSCRNLPVTSSSWVSASASWWNSSKDMCPCDYVHVCLCVYGHVGGQANWSCECAQVCSGQTAAYIQYSVVVGWAVGVWESDQSRLQRELRKNEEIADR